MSAPGRTGSNAPRQCARDGLGGPCPARVRAAPSGSCGRFGIRSLFGIAARPPEPSRHILATVAYRGLTVLLAVLALAGQVTYLDVLYWNLLGVGELTEGGLHPALRTSVIASASVTAVMAVLAIVLALGREGERGARPFALALATWAYMLAFTGLTLLLSPEPGHGLRGIFAAHFLFVEAIASAALLRFTALFPVALTPEALEDPGTLSVWLRPLQRLRFVLLGPRSPWVAAVAAAVLILAVNRAFGRPLEDAALLLLADLLRLAAIAVAVLNLRGAFVARDRDGRRAIFWFVVGFTLLLGAVGVLLGGNLLVAVTGWEHPGFNWRPIVLNLGFVGLVWGATMGVAYRGSLRPGPMTRHVALLATAVMVALFLAAGLESLVKGVVAAPFPVPKGIGTLAAFLAVGLLYARTRRPIESLVYHTWAEPPEGTPEA